MPNEVDKDLLDRLAALRGSSAASPTSATLTPSISIDTIERKKTPTREENLADRLKHLRDGTFTASPPRVLSSTPRKDSTNDNGQEKDEEDGGGGNSLAARLKLLRIGHASPGKDGNTPPSNGQMRSEKSGGQTIGPSHSGEQANQWTEKERQEVEEERDEDDMFQTDDKELEDLLRDIPTEEGSAGAITEPTEAEIKALLEELAEAIPRDDKIKESREYSEKDSHLKKEEDDDDSDGDEMKKEVDEVISRFQDELELEQDVREPQERGGDQEEGKQEEQDDDGSALEEETQSAKEDEEEEGGIASHTLVLPSVPSGEEEEEASSPKPETTTLDSLSSRLAALRSPPSSVSRITGELSSSLALPSVPNAAPSSLPSVKRLTSKTDYTDDDMSSWCTVCLEDATLTCLGCDNDPYCLRCWKEMHLGPDAGWEERSHKAVEFGKSEDQDAGGKSRRRKVAVGA